jgi:glycosyltransferase involved in cell wall biosynthesis
MEDWFSEDLPEDARRTRPIRLLASLERSLLSSGAHTTCTSKSMSDALAAAYGCRPPTVVYNAFPWSERERLDGLRLDRTSSSVPSIHWYSQTIGPDRGLETLFAAFSFVEHEAEVHIRGTAVPGFPELLVASAPPGWRPRIHFHDPVENHLLLSRIAEHDIGFAGEVTGIRSRDLTVTNKVLHYLLGGLAVVASDTSGQREVAASSNAAVRLFAGGAPRSLATRLDELLADPRELARGRSDALHLAKEIYCWEQQAPALLASCDAAVSGGACSHAR